MGEIRTQMSILEVAKPMEAAIVQGAFDLWAYKDTERYRPLQFIHFSDVHGIIDHWDRIVTLLNHYKDYISFAVHTGDYVGGHIEQYVDMYRYGVPAERPVLNCIGNHDKHSHYGAKVTKEMVHSMLFHRTDDWGVSFHDCDFSMAYYKDFPESNIRLIVLDVYYDVDLQAKWLKDVLDDAKVHGYHVMTAMHPPTAEPVSFPDTTFNSLTEVMKIAPVVHPTIPYEEIIADFIDAGGSFICNLCGHLHYDVFGYTKRGVLNISVDMASCWAPGDDAQRVPNTMSYDCFNVMSVDVKMGILRLIRIGNNYDYYLRRKSTLSYDYINKKVIYNG